jgi:hypothetical protein
VTGRVRLHRGTGFDAGLFATRFPDVRPATVAILAPAPTAAASPPPPAPVAVEAAVATRTIRLVRTMQRFLVRFAVRIATGLAFFGIRIDIFTVR